MVFIIDKNAKEKIKPNYNTALFLDVATKYTGYALYALTEVVDDHAVKVELLNYGNIRAGEGEWKLRCVKLTNKIYRLVGDTLPGMLVLEHPTFQGGSRGMAAARSGGTLELAYLCGMISGQWMLYGAQVYKETKATIPLANLVTYNQWAGQTNKQITCHRLKEYFLIDADPNSVDNNWADAVMMGKWFYEAQKVTVDQTHKSERIDL